MLLVPAAIAVQAPSGLPQTSAAIDIDASTVDGRISSLLYGQFIEFMFEGVKYGLHAEMIRDRGFEETPDSTGLSRYWQRYPDNRVDDYAMSFARDDQVAYPEVKSSEGTTGGHSMRSLTHVFSDVRSSSPPGAF